MTTVADLEARVEALETRLGPIAVEEPAAVKPDDPKHPSLLYVPGDPEPVAVDETDEGEKA